MPTWTGFGQLLFVIERSAPLVPVMTTSVTVTECCVTPSVVVAVMLSGKLPTGVAPVVVTVSVDVCAEESAMTTGEGLKLPIEFAGNPLSDKSTLPVKPASGEMVTV